VKEFDGEGRRVGRSREVVLRNLFGLVWFGLVCEELVVLVWLVNNSFGSVWIVNNSFKLVRSRRAPPPLDSTSS
jgi:hypothetical protein